MKTVREQAQAADPQAVVMLTGEHFTNFFLDGLPQLAVGLAERVATPERGG